MESPLVMYAAACCNGQNPPPFLHGPLQYHQEGRGHEQAIVGEIEL